MRGLHLAWRKLTRHERGTEIAESAVVLPLLFVFLIAIFWFGQAFRIYGAVTHAAREGARAAVAPVCSTCATSATSPTANAVNAVKAALTAAHLSSNQIQAPATVPVLCQCPSASASACSKPVACDPAASIANVCVQNNVQLSYAQPTTGAAGAGACGTSVSFGYKYPLHFTLPCFPAPCKSLDLSNVALPARAQVRAETQ